jgi:sugar phosphate isomerase/epimerase
MPGRGKLDFVPLVGALKEINYTGFTQIFMHPTPRGIPILPTAAETTAEINRSRAYLEQCLAKVP